MSEILPEPINFQVKNVLTVDGNIMLEEINSPSVSGTNGTLYKLIGSNALYWKTTSGIVNLTASASITYPLLANNTLTPQYSFSGYNTTGIGHYDDYLYIKIEDDIFIQFDQTLSHIKSLKDLNLDNNDIINVNEIATTSLNSSSINLYSYTDTTNILEINGFFNIVTSGVNYTVGHYGQSFNLTDDNINSTGVSIQNIPILHCQGYTNARLNGGIICLQSQCTLYGTNNLTISPIPQYVGFNDRGIQFDSNFNGQSIDYSYGIVISHVSQPSIQNASINYFYGIYIDEPTDPNIYNKYGVYSNVTNNYLKGIILETSGGSGANLNYYETDTINLTASNAWDQVVNVSFVRIGKMINLIFSDNISSKTVYNDKLILTQLPNRLCPLADIYGLIYGIDNNVNTTLSYIIKTDGQIYIGTSSTNVNQPFTPGVGLNTGYYGTSLTYSCA
jgi:hypothetical protein